PSGRGLELLSNQWMWSGGTQVDQNFWKPGRTHDSPGIIYNNIKYARLTWEEALQYCRTHHTDLASVASETEMMLIKKELSKYPSSDDVWIGLRFLAGEWLWVDGQPFSYESWGASVKPSCPDMSFSLEGWNVHDCEVRRHFLCY
uniref:C-type lectin domain-containing protein n=1 Tax=Neogobius melanostomus TaxID=47308 RepID=A0A8C6SVR3_9GOBI